MKNVRDCIDYNIWRGVEDSLLANLRGNVWDNVRDDVWRNVWDNVRLNVGTNTSYSVWGDVMSLIKISHNTKHFTQKGL